MIEKRFRVTISNTNAVSLVDVVENKQLMSITFKNESDAIDCKNALMYQCDLLNELHKENEQLKQEVETLQEELAHFIGDVE
jgi:FtsZ-binding cell division protein ZapB